jgi:hypothetical protein
MPYEIAGGKPWEAISFPMFELSFFRNRHTKRALPLEDLQSRKIEKNVRVSVNG